MTDEKRTTVDYMGTLIYAGATLGAIVRLTRFVTTDDLGDWLIVKPLEDRAIDAESSQTIWDAEDTRSMPPAIRAVHGLRCPHCVSTWLGIGMTGVALAARHNRVTRAAWFTLTAGLTASLISGYALNALESDDDDENP